MQSLSHIQFMEKFSTNKLAISKKIFITLLFLFGFGFSNAQDRNNETYYILFDTYKDIHNKEANFPSYEICIEDKLIYFRYGTGVKVEVHTEIKDSITDRKKLAEVIANDSFENTKIKFYVIEKVGKFYYKRSVDYRFRLEEANDNFE